MHPGHPNWTVSTALELFRGPVYQGPPGWQASPIVASAFRSAFHDAASQAPKWNPSLASQRRGIVISGGGWKFFPSIYVTASAIRHTGCKLPIQVWYLGEHEFDVRMQQATSHLDVVWVDAMRFARQLGIEKRIWGGWQLKPFSALHSSFQEVFCLDADCYPVHNPEWFMDSNEHKAIGATFFPDINDLRPDQWSRFGLTSRNEPGFETGQYCIDKSRHYKALWLTDWMNDRSDYVYSHIYGDKDTYHLAWRKLGHDYCMPSTRPMWRHVALVNKDFQGNVFLVHRVSDKFKWTGEIDSVPIQNQYNGPQSSPENRFIPELPLESLCHRWLTESSKLVRPELHYCFSDLVQHGAEQAKWKSVVLANKYNLPRDLGASDTVLDIGAFSGDFSIACLDRGAGRVVATESEASRLSCLSSNLRDHAGRSEVVPVPAGELFLQESIRLATWRLGRISLARIDLEHSCQIAGCDLSAIDAVCGEMKSHDKASLASLRLSYKDVCTHDAGDEVIRFWGSK